MVVGELEGLGLEYLRSKGEETVATKIFNQDLKKILYHEKAKKELVPKANESINSTSNKIGELFGEWEITISTINQSYNYKIYVNEKKYFGVKNNDLSKIEKLKKVGNKYVVEGNKFGEYFIIDSKKKMSLFDQDGDLSSIGCTAKKIN